MPVSSSVRLVMAKGVNPSLFSRAAEHSLFYSLSGELPSDMFSEPSTDGQNIDQSLFNFDRREAARLRALRYRWGTRADAMLQSIIAKMLCGIRRGIH